VSEVSPAYRELDEFFQTAEFLELMSEITGIPDLLYDAEYHGGGTHESPHGQGLYPHVDFNYHPRGWHRRLNLIVYLNREWDDSWGGGLDIHSNPWDPASDQIETVPPHFNQAVMFETSEHSWHGFRPINLPPDKRDLTRKSFALYLYTTERPAEQTAASHNTVYVPYGMPKDVQPGEALTKEQHKQLEQRFSELLRMLKFQYDAQLRLSEEFQAGHRFDLLGYGVVTRPPVGRWADTWVSKEFNIEFAAVRPVRGLQLEIATPPQLEEDQVLEIQAGDWQGTETNKPGETRTVNLPVSLDAGRRAELTIHAGSTCRPGERDLAYRITSAQLEH
jgi:hypothetical protein